MGEAAPRGVVELGPEDFLLSEAFPYSVPTPCLRLPGGGLEPL